MTPAARSISPESRQGAKSQRSAGARGDAAQWGGSSAAVGMAARRPLAIDASCHLIVHLAIWRDLGYKCAK